MWLLPAALASGSGGADVGRQWARGEEVPFLSLWVCPSLGHPEWGGAVPEDMFMASWWYIVANARAQVDSDCSRYDPCESRPCPLPLLLSLRAMTRPFRSSLVAMAHSTTKQVAYAQWYLNVVKCW